MLHHRYWPKRKEILKHVFILKRKMKNIQKKNKILNCIMESQKAEIKGLTGKNYELVNYIVLEKCQISTLKDENNQLTARNYKTALDYNATKEELIRSNHLINVIDDIIKVTTEYLLNAKKAVNDYFTYIPVRTMKQNAEDTNDHGCKSNLKCSSQEKLQNSEVQGERELTMSDVTEVEESSSLPLIPNIEEISPLPCNYFQETQPASVVHKDSQSIQEQVLEAEENLLLFPISEEKDDQSLETQSPGVMSNDKSLSEVFCETEKNRAVCLEEEILSPAFTFTDHNFSAFSRSDNKDDCNNKATEVSMTSDSGYKDNNGMLDETLKISTNENSSQEWCSLQNNRHVKKLVKYFEVNLRSSSLKDTKLQSPVKKNVQRLCKNTKQSKGTKNIKTANSENIRGKSQFRKTRSLILKNQDSSNSSEEFYKEENGMRTRPKRNVPKINYKI